jgi:hypothetical protein
MSATDRAEIRTKLAIKDYEAETGIAVAGNAKLEEAFWYLSLIYLIHATLSEMRFRRDFPTA